MTGHRIAWKITLYVKVGNGLCFLDKDNNIHQSIVMETLTHLASIYLSQYLKILWQYYFGPVSVGVLVYIRKHTLLT